MNDIEFTKKTYQFINKPWKLGGDGKEGWDCISSIKSFFESCGIELPKEFKGWTWENYCARWERGEGMTIFKEFLLSLGHSVSIDQIQRGDIIVLEKNDLVSCGLYVGNAHMQVIPKEYGTTIVPIGFFRSAIIDVRRLLS
jgi:cell wall-associated NlpC family hydrolase